MADGRFVGSVGELGMGYVGLPLAAALAEAGLSVIGIQKDPNKVTALEGGGSYVEDVPCARLNHLLRPAAATGDYAPRAGCPAR